MKRSMCFFLLLLGSVFLLCGCGNTTKSEEEILQDIKNERDVFETYGLDILNFEITNRKTDTEGKSDVVYCSILAQNSELKYACDYVITYFLYDQGWMVEELYSENTKTIPLYTTVVKEQAIEDGKKQLVVLCADYHTSFPFYREEVNLDEGIHKFYFANETKEVQLIVEYTFSIEYGWTLESLNVDTIGLSSGKE